MYTYCNLISLMDILFYFKSFAQAESETEIKRFRNNYRTIVIATLFIEGISSDHRKSLTNF